LRKPLVFWMLLVSSAVMAQTKVVVIPMGGDALPLQNVITVAKKNGDFTDPVDAMKSITITDENNRYLVVIGPGVYTLTETLVMREYTDISGSGRNATKLTGAVSTGNLDETSALVQGANNAGISSLSIENTGGDAVYIGIYNSSSSTMSDLSITASEGSFENIGVYNSTSAPTMSDLSITASGGNYSRGVRNSTSSPMMSDLSITASGGNTNLGVHNSSSSPTMYNMSITASGGSGTNLGVANYSSSPAMYNMRITASGGGGSRGVFNYSSSPTMYNMRITASGESSAYGVYNYAFNSPPSSPTMSNMTITVSGAGDEKIGVHNQFYASPTMSDTSITVSGGSINYGVYNLQSSSSTMSHMSITVTGGSGMKYGVYNSNSLCSARIRNSSISGSTNSVAASYGSGTNETYISDSILTGSVSGAPVCSFTFSNTGTDLTTNCGVSP
jgi:hypothetical protein